MQAPLEFTAQAGEDRASSLLDRLPSEVLSHSVRVTAYSVALGTAWGLQGQELDDLFWGALLHDAGKALLPASVLAKPAGLNSREWRWMQRHPHLGAALARRAGFSARVEEIVLTHQERWDGAGYPSGMGGLDIPLASRLLAVADTYDCLTSSRPYRPARRPLAALAELRRSAGTQLQPEVVACFEGLPCCNGRRRQRALALALA